MSDSYTHDLLVLGGGAAGLTAAGTASVVGAKTVLVERARLGGDCTWTGCVPSKALLKAAHVAHEMRHAERYGLPEVPEFTIDLKAVMDRVRHLRQEIYDDADAPPQLEKLGIEIAEGEARFVDAHAVEVESGGQKRRISARRIIVAAGGRPMIPPIRGLADVPYLTSESLFDELDALPERLGIVGAGPIGTEMAQAFARLGSRVIVFESGERILSHDDPELAQMLQGILTREGVQYRTGVKVTEVERYGEGVIVTAESEAGQAEMVEVDALLIAVGRQPNVETLNLEAAGVEYGEKGIDVDDRCCTSQSHIFAAGDVTGRYQFTHMSEHMAKVAATNAVLRVPMKIDTDHVPWVTYTAPELAHVGATEQQLRERGEDFKTYSFPYSKVDRAITDSVPEGLIKVHASPLLGHILGASVLGAHAGELICEYALAMKSGVSLRQIADTIHPYPTYGLGARRAADQWYIAKQSATLAKVVKRIFGYRGPIIELEEGAVL
jgi:pyruvate/2-oxoglutarate dehydrogenase complex dihydrolipoamide dehydrogenase (E3) component